MDRKQSDPGELLPMIFNVSRKSRWRARSYSRPTSLIRDVLHGVLCMRYFASLSMTRGCAQYDKGWGTKPASLCHAERSEAQSKHLYMLASHLGLLYLRIDSQHSILHFTQYDE